MLYAIYLLWCFCAGFFIASMSAAYSLGDVGEFKAAKSKLRHATMCLVVMFILSVASFFV